ncbi:MAG: hypothetical protein JWN04_6213 [Myxococcaceae bacterium]|nr:hypothetical protein [Myxococcaceae bacterium]
MRYRNGMAAALGLLSLVSCVWCRSQARAQEPGPVDGGVTELTVPATAVFALHVEPDIVSSAALRTALESELGVAVADVSAAPAGIPTIAVAWVASGNVEVSLISRSLPRVSRELALTSQRPEERVETVALIASNMVRNEAAALLPDLQPVGSTPAGAVAPGKAAPDKASRVVLVNPCDVRGDAIFGIDFAPGIGNSSTPAGRAAMRRFSLGFAGTLSSRLDGLELSLGANIKTISVCGAQLTYAANIALGPVQGLQLATFNLTTDNLQGVQGGLVNVTSKSVLGVQGGLVNIAGQSVFGAQGGIANFTAGSLRGAQGGVANLVVGNLSGLQAGVVNVTVGKLTGLQGAVANYAGSTHGAQLGVANISAGEVRGTQIGLFNYADKSTASIGLLSVVRRGRTSIDLLAQPDTGTLTAGITHGSKYVHNSYGVGTRIGRDGQRLVASAGIGVRVVSTSLLRVDLDAIGSHFITGHMNKTSTGTAGLRAPVTFMLFRGFGVVAAPSYQVMITNEAREHDPSAFGHKTLHSGSTRVLGYPSLTIGLRYEFDHGV